MQKEQLWSFSRTNTGAFAGAKLLHGYGGIYKLHNWALKEVCPSVLCLHVLEAVLLCYSSRPQHVHPACTDLQL